MPPKTRILDGLELAAIRPAREHQEQELERRDRHLRQSFSVSAMFDMAVYAELIFNLACPASPLHYQTDPHATLTSSVLGALRLVEHARSRRCRIIQASTSEVYGDPLVHPQPEDYAGNVNPIG